MQKRQNKTNLFDFLIEALRVEAITTTGRINLVAIIFLGASLLLIVPSNPIVILVNAFLVYCGKSQLELLPMWVVIFLCIFTAIFFLLCLYIVYDMERKKQSIRQDKKC